MPPPGFPPPVAATLRARAAGRCEVCAAAPDAHSHHRRPRRMGGSRNPATNGLCNGLRLCLPCHDWVESNRAAGYELGLLLPAAADPALSPARLITVYGPGWWLLDDTGGYVACVTGRVSSPKRPTSVSLGDTRTAP